jgi:hypothetical protein
VPAELTVCATVCGCLCPQTLTAGSDAVVGRQAPSQISSLKQNPARSYELEHEERGVTVSRMDEIVVASAKLTVVGLDVRIRRWVGRPVERSMAPR